MSTTMTPQTVKQHSDNRTPIPIEKLFFSAANPHGVKLPDGIEGKSERIMPNLTAGVQGSEKIEIEHRPWLRVFRVTKSRKVTRTGKDGKEIAEWTPMGKPFQIPDTWAVSVPADE